jgi:acetyltransferase-like isoleucine patch superfamily enzyme
MDRMRAAGWRLRGAALGSKNRVGAGCAVDRPWQLCTGERVQIEAGVHLKMVDETARIALGAFTFIGLRSELDIAGELRIGSHVLIAPGCFITDHAHRHADGVDIDAQGTECRPVRIGNDVWLGAHVVVLPGVTIGDGAVIGAGAVVTRDVAPRTVIAGVPARPLRHRR